MDKWFKNNNFIKVVSFILAIMLWLVVNLDSTSSNNTFENNNDNSYFFNTKVEIKYNNDLYVADLSTDEIRVTISGNKDSINNIRNGENIDRGEFFINLEGYEEGTYTVPIQYTGFSDDLTVDIQPNSIDVTLESKIREEVTVIVEKYGVEAEGYQAGEPIIKPKKVYIEGSEEQIEQVAYVKAIVNIDKIKKSIVQNVPLKALDNNGNELSVDITPQTVEVEVPVTSPFITVPISFKIDQYPSDGFAIKSIDYSPKEITLYGSKDLLEHYTVYSLPNLNLAEINSNQTFTINVPLNEELLKIEPNEIEFNIEVEESQLKNINNIPVEIKGLGEGLTAELLTYKDGVDITVEGTKQFLETLGKDNIQAYIDLTNLPSGEYEIEIKYNIPLLANIVKKNEIINVKIINE